MNIQASNELIYDRRHFISAAALTLAAGLGAIGTAVAEAWDFAKLIWQMASPKWDFDDATFARTATAFDNPDHVAIVIHNYR